MKSSQNHSRYKSFSDNSSVLPISNFKSTRPSQKNFKLPSRDISRNTPSLTENYAKKDFEPKSEYETEQ